MATQHDAEKTEQLGPGRGRGNLVFDWTVATAGGMAAALILGLILAMVLFAAGFGTGGGGFGAAIIGGLLGIAAAGILIGWTQARILARVDTDTGWTHHVRGRWIWATAGGWVAALFGGYLVLQLIGSLLPRESPSSPGLLAATLVALATAGTLLGLAQWLVLRTHVEHAGAWVAACAAGTAGGGILLSPTLLLFTGYATALLGSAIAAAGLGLVTGLALTTLLDMPALRPHLIT